MVCCFGHECSSRTSPFPLSCLPRRLAFLTAFAVGVLLNLCLFSCGMFHTRNRPRNRLRGRGALTVRREHNRLLVIASKIDAKRVHSSAARMVTRASPPFASAISQCQVPCR